jgi:hypothetical protein
LYHVWQYEINKKAYRTKKSGLEINSAQTIFSLQCLYRHVTNWSIKEHKWNVTHKMTAFKNGIDYFNMDVSVCTYAIQRNCNNQIGKLELCEIRQKTTGQFTETSILFNMSPGYTRSKTTRSIALIRGAYKI